MDRFSQGHDSGVQPVRLHPVFLKGKSGEKK
jgi:hypothetical protein